MVGFLIPSASVAAEAVEQLEPVEVSASRIPPPKRPLPMPLPEVSTATPLPPDGLGDGMSLEGRGTVQPQARRLLRDETAQALGVRTRVQYRESLRPPYPKRAREMGWQGTVLLRVEVKEDGTAGGVTVRQSSGRAILDEAAQTAVKGWRFAPPMDGGFSMSTVVDVPVRFDLKEYREHPDGGPGS
jgi:protein TonB